MYLGEVVPGFLRNSQLMSQRGVELHPFYLHIRKSRQEVLHRLILGLSSQFLGFRGGMLDEESLCCCMNFCHNSCCSGVICTVTDSSGEGSVFATGSMALQSKARNKNGAGLCQMPTHLQWPGFLVSARARDTVIWVSFVRVPLFGRF